MNKRGTAFAISAIAVFATGSLIVLGLDVAERAEAIGSLTESSTKLVVWLVLLAVLNIAARNLPQSARVCVFICTAFILLRFVLKVVDDTPTFNAVPIIGHESSWRKLVEKAIVCCWTCTAFILLYSLISRLEDSYDKLRLREMEQIKSNERLQQALLDLKESQDQVIQQERLAALGQMAGGAAHDLNNALSPIIAFARLLQTDDDFVDHRESLDLMRAGAEHAAEVIKKLQYFYSEQGDANSGHEVVNLSEAARHAVRLTRFRWHDEALKHGMHIQVRLKIQDGCYIRGNSTELTQMLINLLVNAIDAMPNGGLITVSVSSVETAVRLAVSDQGPGMTPEQRARCFEPFYSTKSGGSGLGLSVCHGIAKRHGAVIEAEPSLLKGTQFVVTFPQRVMGTGECAVEEVEITGKKKVLVIDDNKLVRESLSAQLRSRGMQVDTAGDGPHGIEVAQAKAYDLFIADFGMPGMTGREVVTLLKESFPSIPVVIASGWPMQFVDSQFFEGDAKPDFVIEKPIGDEAIERCLEVILNE